jgi:hypothetical protein
VHDEDKAYYFHIDKSEEDRGNCSTPLLILNFVQYCSNKWFTFHQSGTNTVSITTCQPVFRGLFELVCQYVEGGWEGINDAPVREQAT